MFSNSTAGYSSMANISMSSLVPMFPIASASSRNPVDTRTDVAPSSGEILRAMLD